MLWFFVHRFYIYSVLLCNIARFLRIQFFSLFKGQTKHFKQLHEAKWPGESKIGRFMLACTFQNSKTFHHASLSTAISLLTAFNLIFEHYSFCFFDQISYRHAVEIEWNLMHSFDLWLGCFSFFLSISRSLSLERARTHTEKQNGKCVCKIRRMEFFIRCST